MKKSISSVATIVAIALAIVTSVRTEARPAGGDQSGKYEVTIDNFSFSPATLTIPAGATVTWINHDDVPHNILSSEGKILRSPVLDTDQKFSYTFNKPGTYPYYCGIHPKMIGKVVVQ